jgi:phytoene dehydrogenase-like protein
VSSVVIIGAGHNGLAAAFYLAKANRKPLVLEARDVVGGGAITSEIHPGFRCPTLTHDTALAADVTRDMELERHGLQALASDVELFAPDGDGRGLVIHRDPRRTSQALARFGDRDARAYPSYRAAMDRIAGVVGSLFSSPPPSVDQPSAVDLWALLRTGRAFRGLGKRDGYRLLRWAPMPAADLMGEWFESDLMRAALAAPALSGTMLGPRSAGSALVLLMREAHVARANGIRHVRGGPGALTTAMAAAARAAGAQIRTGAAVERIVVRDDRVTSVVVGREEIRASAVMSSADPKTTFLRLLDPADLTPDFMLKMRNYRAAGTIAKVNLALSALPSFRGAADAMALSARIHVGPEIDYLERAFDSAKYGALSEEPWLDIRLPSILEPDLAPPGAHVMSIYAHYAPYRLRGAEWAAHKETLLRRVLSVLEGVAPGVGALVVSAQMISPQDLEQDYGFFGGHPFHGELAPDQLFAMRPLLGHARYETPIRGLFLCGAGTHPGGFLTGTSGRLAAREIVRIMERTR